MIGNYFLFTNWRASFRFYVHSSPLCDWQATTRNFIEYLAFYDVVSTPEWVGFSLLKLQENYIGCVGYCGAFVRGTIFLSKLHLKNKSFI